MLTSHLDDKKGPKFEVGQHIKVYDTDEECVVNGEILEVGDETILVKWEDLTEPTEYEIAKISMHGEYLIDHTGTPQ
jgi:hypothetical protein